ncbi:MAG: hypothetical protein Q4C10_01890 [Clostridia bacterium]|nr:hypothetical protein [Clostridia bacterium]
MPITQRYFNKKTPRTQWENAHNLMIPATAALAAAFARVLFLYLQKAYDGVIILASKSTINRGKRTCWTSI